MKRSTNYHRRLHINMSPKGRPNCVRAGEGVRTLKDKKSYFTCGLLFTACCCSKFELAIMTDSDNAVNIRSSTTLLFYNAPIKGRQGNLREGKEFILDSPVVALLTPIPTCWRFVTFPWFSVGSICSRPVALIHRTLGCLQRESKSVRQKILASG